MNQQNELLTTETDAKPSAENTAVPRDVTRRKFLLTAGVSALPVMMSVKSGNAWGCVGLDCTSGTGNLSGTRSAVLSAKATKQQNYIIPQWDKISNIQKIITVDFGRNVTKKHHGFLLNHYDFACYKEKESGKTIVISEELPNEDAWYHKAKNLLAKGKLYIGNEKFRETKDPQKRIYGLIRPAVYDDIIITAQTDMGNFFSEMSGVTVWDALITGNDFEKYVTAAFIGSVWESHSIWDSGYPGSVVNTQCYPKPDELMAAYNMVITRNASEHPNGIEGAIYDMGQLFKLYTRT